MKLNGFCLWLFVILVFSRGWPVYAGADVLSSIEQRVERFQARYGIALLYKDIKFTGDSLQFTPVSEKEYGLLNDYLGLFEEEINKYPPGFFKEHEVRGIALVTRLFYFAEYPAGYEGESRTLRSQTRKPFGEVGYSASKNEPSRASTETPSSLLRGGSFSKEKAAQGLYNPHWRVMFFEISRSSDNKALQRHSIHHELFHMMATQTPGYRLNDERWSAFNPRGFTYGEENKSPQETNPVNPQAPDQLGFATHYAMTSVEEDKAEVFACLMQEANKRLITRWAERDPALRKKVQAIKDFAALYNKEMDEEYWGHNTQ